MNKTIAQLHEVASKSKRNILGLMSGTSLDGLDLAYCTISGAGLHTRVELLRFSTVPYPPAFRDELLRVFAKKNVDQLHLSGMHVRIAEVHAQMVLQTLQDWGIATSDVDVLASHGQTVFHAPTSQQSCYPNNTLQLGDGDHLAVRTGILTLSDFRQKHVAAGGEGAPLAIYGDYLLFSSDSENRVLLNLGGIANFTYLPSRKMRECGVQAYATDVGPANTLMNQYMQRAFQLPMDEHATMGKKGRVDIPLLQILESDSFFQLPYPKTTGPEYFNLQWLEGKCQSKGLQLPSSEDLLATLCAFSARTIAAALKPIAQNVQETGATPLQVYISGGGVENPLLMQFLQEEIRNFQGRALISLHRFERLGLEPGAKEAVLFAVLANETLVGDPAQLKGLHGAPAVCMGKISFPH